MQTKNNILTKEERDVLILAAPHLDKKQLSNGEIAQRLDIPVGKVKTLIHQACIKLGANNRIEALLFAMKQGDITLNECYSLDELAEVLSPLDPDTLRRIIHLVHQKLEQGYAPKEDEQTFRTNRRQDTLLTERERDVLILAARGFANKEIADHLFISIGSVGIFLNRACRKLGANGKIHAVALALKNREITLGDSFSPYELAQYLTRSGVDNIERMDQMLMIDSAKSATASEVGYLQRSPCPYFMEAVQDPTMCPRPSESTSCPFAPPLTPHPSDPALYCRKEFS